MRQKDTENDSYRSGVVHQTEGIVRQSTVGLSLATASTLVMDMIATDLVELVEECHVRHLTRSQALLIQHRQNATIILKKNKSQNFSNLP